MQDFFAGGGRKLQNFEVIIPVVLQFVWTKLTLVAIFPMKTDAVLILVCYRNHYACFKSKMS